MKCETCEKETKYLESHHIVPKSRGGSDSKSNLIKICIDCHSKAHDVVFSKNRGGLIKEGVINYKKRNAEAKKWLDNNDEYFLNKMMDLYEKDEVKYGLIMGLIHHGKMSDFEIMKYLKGEKVVIKTQLSFN